MSRRPREPGCIVTSELPSNTTILYGAIATLCGAVAYLAKMIFARLNETNQAVTKQRDECFEKHDKANAKIIDLSREVGEVKGWVEAQKQLKGLTGEAMGKLLPKDDE